jgi:hypothetical protein
MENESTRPSAQTLYAEHSRSCAYGCLGGSFEARCAEGRRLQDLAARERIEARRRKKELGD